MDPRGSSGGTFRAIPPWSMAMSTATAPGRIERIISRVTRRGARSPVTNTVETRRSASFTAPATAPGVDGIVRALPPHARCASESFSGSHVEDRHVRAERRGDPRGVAPGHPGPENGHVSRRRAGRSAEQDTASPAPFSSPRAPTWMERIPATSLIGRRIGKAPPETTVS